jgi:hypothetical protein
MGKVEEQAMANLASSGLTPGEQLDAYLTQRRIDAVMKSVVADHRAGNIHAQLSGPGAPQRPTPETKPDYGPKGFIEDRPLERPPGIDLIDAMCIADDARQRRKTE